MSIQELVKSTRKPNLYDPGNAVMWTDPHISKQLLDIHLDEHIDLASRKPETIQQTVDWILSHTHKRKLKILDLGCGPGLYSEIFARKGHEVTGVDFSEKSIQYARNVAKSKDLAITYLHENYLRMDAGQGQYDLVILIFADFGPLLPGERDQFLSKVRRVLKPEGLFVFDVLNDNDIPGKMSPRSWECAERGFWSDAPYLCLSESFLFEEEHVVLYQHIVAIEDKKVKVYRFWNHFFTNADLKVILTNSGFDNVAFYNNVIPDGDGYTSDDITFCVALNS